MLLASNNGKTVNKLKGYRFQIGDYLIYNKEKDFYYNLSYSQNNNKKICLIAFYKFYIY